VITWKYDAWSKILTRLSRSRRLTQVERDACADAVDYTKQLEKKVGDLAYLVGKCQAGMNARDVENGKAKRRIEALVAAVRRAVLCRNEQKARIAELEAAPSVVTCDACERADQHCNWQQAGARFCGLGKRRCNRE
jgi:hypothetical protein